MNNDQAMTYGQIRFTPDPAGNTEWRTIMGGKAIQAVDAFPDNLETQCGFGNEEKILWRLLAAPRSYGDLENSKLLLPDEICAMVRGLFAAELIEIIEGNQAIPITPEAIGAQRDSVTRNPASGKFKVSELLGEPPASLTRTEEVFEAGQGGISRAAPAMPDLEISALEIEPLSAAPAAVDGAMPTLAPAAAARPAVPISALASPSLNRTKSDPMFSAAPEDDGIDLNAITGKTRIPVIAPAAAPAAAPAIRQAAAPPRPVVAPRSPTPAPRAPAPPSASGNDLSAKKAALEKAYAQSKHEDPYAVLGVSEKATADELKKAHANLLKAIHPDMLPPGISADRALREKAEGAFEAVNHAWEILGNPERKAAHDQAQAAIAEAQNITPQMKAEQARRQLKMGETFVGKKDYLSAELHLKTALELNPDNPAAQTLLAWCTYYDPKSDAEERHARAQAMLKKTMKQSEYADAAYRLGLILRMEEKPDEAMGFFHKAVSLDPKHQAAAQEVRLAERRSKGAFGLFSKKR
jgi:curved DNA-binding protein CbpA